MNEEMDKLNKQITIWNLRCLEAYLVDMGRAGEAYTIRQALDLLSSNWRVVKDYKGINPCQ